MMKAAAPITGGINCPPVEPTDFDRGGARRRKPGARHQRNGDDADRHHVAHRGARDHAEQRGADHRDLGGAAAKIAHSRHGEIGEIGRAAGAAEHLAHQRERHHDQNGDLTGCCRSCRWCRDRDKRSAAAGDTARVAKSPACAGR